MVKFYLLTFPRFPLRMKEHKSYFGKNRTHDFRTSRCVCRLPTRPLGRRVSMYVCITYSKSMGKPGKVANLAHGQLKRENGYSLSAFTPEHLVSRDGFGSPVPRQPAHLHTQAESGAYLQVYSRVSRWRPFIYLNHHNTPSGQSRVYRVTQLRIDGVHCREYTSTGSVNLKVVPSECCLGTSTWTS